MMEESLVQVQVMVGDKVLYRKAAGKAASYAQDFREVLQAKYHLEEALKTIEMDFREVGFSASTLPGHYPSSEPVHQDSSPDR